MSEAGYARDTEGFYADGQGNRIHVDFAVQDASEIMRMQQILSDSWRRAGFDMRTVVMGIQHFTQLENRNTLPGFSYAAGRDRGNIPRLADRIGGKPMGGHKSSGLGEPGVRSPLRQRGAPRSTRLNAGGTSRKCWRWSARAYPAYSLYFLPDVKSWSSALQGPTTTESSGFGRTARGTTVYWDIHNWTLR